MRTDEFVSRGQAWGRAARRLAQTSARPNKRSRRSRPRRIAFLATLALCASGVPNPVRAADGPIFLFGGTDFGDFLGCLNCDRSEAFSVWNESGEFGSPTKRNSIWNREGPYGSPTSDTSPWNPRASKPPVAVDRIGNLYGYFTRNPVHPLRVRRNDGHSYHADFDLLAWLLENYEWVITHLDEVRNQH